MTIQDLRNAIFVVSAQDRDLSRLGTNYGVQRPRYNAMSDDLYRKVLHLVAWQPKMIAQMVYALLEAFYGPADTAGWKVFQVVPNKITVELPHDLSAGSLERSTYLQQNPVAPSTTLTGDHTGGSTTLTVGSTVGFATSGTLVLDLGRSVEILLYASKTPTTFALVESTRRHHLGTVAVTQYLVEPDSASYRGDYFGATPRNATLAAPVAPTATSFTINAGHSLPSKGRLVVGENTASREAHYCTVTGNVITIADVFNPQIVNPHLAGDTVTFFDLPASTTEPSAASNGENPVILSEDTVALDLLAYLDLIVAAGVIVEVRRIG